jgi:hypothetical protein
MIERASEAPPPGALFFFLRLHVRTHDMDSKRSSFEFYRRCCSYPVTFSGPGLAFL